jgi:hypothetical protein
MKKMLIPLMGAVAIGAVACGQNGGADIAMDDDDISGVVTGGAGPEAGVWVIAETSDLPTKYVRIVVTDDQGRYLLPDLPAANYDIWVRGYGLVDSAKVQSEPGASIDLTAGPVADAATAAQYYPAIYWYSMLELPEPSLFPGTGPEGNGMPEDLQQQEQWIMFVKTGGCYNCHQIGNKATRELSPLLGEFESSADAWARRIQSGQASGNMVDAINRFHPQLSLRLFGEWTDRIAAGELPFAQPPRPQGEERNLVVTMWDWGEADAYQHDEISTDRRYPTVNANGLIYGSAEESSDAIPVLDPVNHRAWLLQSEWRDENTPTTLDNPFFAPSIWWGEERIWDSHTNIHNPMFDETGKVWFTTRIRAPENPAFCLEGSEHPSAQIFPLARSGRQLSVYDPATDEFTLIDTCYQTHHLQFDNNNMLWLSSGGGIADQIGWFDRTVFDTTGDAEAAQGWAPFILDTNANGQRDEWVEPNDPIDPTKDKRFRAGYYGVAPSPLDGSIWGSVLGFPGMLVRYDPATMLSEFYEPPLNTEDPNDEEGFYIRGMDITTDGVVWVPLVSGHLASFDRRLCQGPLNGPEAATGKHCPGGWQLHRLPGPNFRNAESTGSADSPYYTFVDQHDTLGLGVDLPVITGNASDSLFAFKDGAFLNMVVPYPMGFFAKGVDGRIDDPEAGWKGRGLWSTYAGRNNAHLEGGKGTMPKVVKFQMRPDPLAH